MVLICRRPCSDCSRTMMWLGTSEELDADSMVCERCLGRRARRREMVPEELPLPVIVVMVLVSALLHVVVLRALSLSGG